MTLSPETRAKAVLSKRLAGLPHTRAAIEADIATAIREAEAQAEQRALDRCREIISRAIISDKTDGEGMRQLLMAAFDPRWDTVANIIKPKD